jgi:outer membrane protein
MTSIAIALFFAQTRVVTLSDALQTALRHQPQIRQARANTEAAIARANEARSQLLPQLAGLGSYTRATSNPIPGALINIGASNVAGAAAMAAAMGNVGPTRVCCDWNLQTDTWNFRITASQTIWDGSGQLARWGSTRYLADAQAATEFTTRLQIDLTVRQNYFATRAQKALLEVARATLANQDKHLAQIEGFVKVGTHAEIDLAQARADRANAMVQMINAENNFEVAKAQLNLAMGIEGPTDYDVSDENIGPVSNEESSVDALLDEALKSRPDFVAIEKQIKAQDLTIWAAKTTYGPSLTASTGFTDGGAAGLGNLAWNWNFALTVNWSLFQGGLSWYTVKEAKANYDSLVAQRDLLRQSVRLEVDQARLALRAAKGALVAAEEALVNARERLRLAEGRYQAGVGNIIELSDSQLQFTQASSQRVQADYNVSTARAALMKALGRF